MFGLESASWGVTGSYRSGCYIGMGAYYFFLFFLLEQRISKPRLFGCSDFP